MDFLKHDQHSPTSDFIGMNIDHQLLPTITKPTRVTRSSATLIDNILIGKAYQTDFQSSIVVDDISDHFPLIMKTDKPILYKGRNKEVTTRGINPAKCEEINQVINSYDWKTLLRDKDTNEAFNLFHGTLQATLDIICPVHTIKLTKNKIRKEPWLTSGLQRCIRKQKLLYRKQLATVSVETDRTKYLNYRNTLNRILRTTKEQYYRQKCIDFKNNTAKLWKMINRIISKENDKINCVEYLKIENISYYDTKIITEEFGKFFSEVGRKYAHNICPSKIKIEDYVQRIPQNDKSLFMTPTCEQEVLKIIDSLANKTSSGYDKLDNNLLKQLSHSICLPLSIIFNKSLMSGVFPQEMKKADVIPLYKAKERYYVSNYRSISLLLKLSKILEKGCI